MKITRSQTNLAGRKFILDADGDSSLTADTDDQLDIELAGADEYTLTASALNVLGNDIDMGTQGARIDLDTDNDTSIRASGDDVIDIEVGGSDLYQITATGITFTADTADPGDTVCGIWRRSTGTGRMGFKVASGNEFNFFIAGAESFNISTSSLFAPNGVGIGDTATGNKIDNASGGSDSTTLYIGNETITTSSDIRLKENIVPTTRNATEIFRQMNVVDFTWNDPSDIAEVNRNSRGIWTGMIGQELIDTVPWIINAPDRTCPICKAGDTCVKHPSYWLVDYEALVPLVVKGLQEIDNRINKLEQMQHKMSNGWFKEQLESALAEMEN